MKTPGILALAAATVLAACGGGGGSGGSGTTAVGGGPQALAITAGNAKPVGANALDAAQNTSATSAATGLPVGVQLSGGSAPELQALSLAARFATTSFGGARLAAGVSVSETTACPLGGTMTITGSVANPTAGFGAGDSLAVTTANCAIATGSSTSVMNGQMSIAIQSGSLATLPFHAVLAITATNLSIQSGGITVVANGDVRLDWTGSSDTSQVLVASGSSLTSRETIGGATHSSTLANFTQTLTVNGGTVTSSVAGTVTTDSPRIGSQPVTYTIATTTPVVWNSSSRSAVAGVVHVTGANNSQLLLTVNPDGSVSLQVDANGDGSYETSVPTNTAELAGLV